MYDETSRLRPGRLEQRLSLGRDVILTVTGKVGSSAPCGVRGVINTRLKRSLCSKPTLRLRRKKVKSRHGLANVGQFSKC